MPGVCVFTPCQTKFLCYEQLLRVAAVKVM